MAISFENANKPVTWGELVNLLAELHNAPEVDEAKKKGNQDEVAHAISKLPSSPGRKI